jgi:hypothetical protein
MRLVYDRDALARTFRAARPFPFVAIDGFLPEEEARSIAASYPRFDHALGQGTSFDFVNERRKVQVTDSKKFPDPVRQLHEATSSPEFLSDLEHITGIKGLLADPELSGGGMHLTAGGGRLDVHVDFNFEERRQYHRRLNLLIYLNPQWNSEWGGELELWDREVTACQHRFEPRLGRCVIFETSDISYHGVQPVRCPGEQARLSYAAYYYTREAPEGWDGAKHSTIFRARPEEKLRRYVLMPLERFRRETIPAMKREVKARIKRARKTDA